jgi:hypothetical protein
MSEDEVVITSDVDELADGSQYWRQAASAMRRGHARLESTMDERPLKRLKVCGTS